MVTSLNKGIETSTKELGKKSLDYMKKQYMENNLSSHTGNITLTPYKNRYKNGFIISSGDDEVAVYNEFGTGIVGVGTNPLATDTGYEYNVTSPYKGYIPEGAIAQYGLENCKKWTTPNTWWYLKNGKWHHTEGMKDGGKKMYYGLVEEIKDVYVNDLKVAVSKTIGNYGGKK